MRKVSKVVFWVIALILFPIIAGLYFIWPSKILSDVMNKGWRIFWWVVYAILASIGAVSKVLICLTFFLISYEDSGPIITRYDVPASDYTTGEDFYKLTGVEFPELEMVDSLCFQDGGFPTNYWREYKFIAKDGLSDSFYERLEHACETDSTHWHYGPISDYFYSVADDQIDDHVADDQMVYHYCIYPEQRPVDRSRGLCDRMVEGSDGQLIVDWDGTYISVDILNDIVILREGWVR